MIQMRNSSVENDDFPCQLTQLWLICDIITDISFISDILLNFVVCERTPSDFPSISPQFPSISPQFSSNFPPVLLNPPSILRLRRLTHDEDGN